jgi:hypothetical protein
MIPVETPKGILHVWTKRVGDNHDRPGATHEYFEAGIEHYYYDQLGSA